MSAEHILLAEDEELLRMGLEYFLREAGYRVTTAENGRDALEKIRGFRASAIPIDLLVLDIQMPEMDGLELQDQLERDGVDIPVLVITSFGDRETLEQLLHRGCAEYVPKPFKPEEFLESVSKTLRKFSRSQALKQREIDDLEKDNSMLAREITEYRRKYANLRDQLDTAIVSYRNLTDFDVTQLRVKLAYRRKALHELGGDFLGAQNAPSGSDILIADVAGHNMGAAFHSVMIKSFFDENTRDHHDGKTFLNILNMLLRNETNERMVTALYAGIDLDKKRLTVVCAGQPFLIRFEPNNSEPLMFEGRGDVLGIKRSLNINEISYDIQSGSRFFMYTDGVCQATRVDGETGRGSALGDKGLAAILAKYRHRDLNETLDATWNEVMAFCRRKPKDDMLLAGVEIP